MAALPARKNPPICAAKTRVATIAAKSAEANVPPTSAASPARSPSAAPAAVPTLSTSAAATPSGYGRLDVVTSARRSGTLYITPRIPPIAQIENETPKGKPLHQPIITSPGNTKMIADSVPAAEATVWTMLFS